MRLKELRGLPVIDPTAARKIGTVTDYQVDPASGRLAALDVSGITTGEPERILAPRIRRVGQSAVILTARGGTAPSADVDVDEHWLDSASLVGLEVMGDDGNRVGRLVDASFEQDSLDIDAYLLKGGFWEQILSRGGRIAPAKVHACSRELMIVNTGRVKELTVGEATTGLSLPMKPEDRLTAPTFEHVPDGQPVSARSS